MLRVTARGKLSTTGTPTMIFSLRLGGVAGVLLCKSAAITTSSGAANVGWSLEITLIVRTNGASGTILAMGTADVSGATVITNQMGVAGAAAPAASAAVDLTADQALSLTGTWSAQSASNTLQTLFYLVEALN